MDIKFEREKHKRFLMHCFNVLPEDYSSMESHQITLAYFVLNAMDIMGDLDSNVSAEKRKSIIDWVYSLQVCGGDSGFRGSNFTWNCSKMNNDGKTGYDYSHLTMAYAALSTLVLLGDDLSRVNKKKVLKSLSGLQKEDGSFIPTKIDLESDMRFVFSACAVCYLLKDWSGVDKDKIVSFIKNSLGYSGSFGQSPHEEAHGGSSYCAIASLKLMNRLGDLSDIDTRRITEWCLSRLKSDPSDSGFQGRVNKNADSCYSFWIGGTLSILNPEIYKMIDKQRLISFVLNCQNTHYGGFAKFCGVPPDLLHTHMSLSGLSLCMSDEIPLQDIVPFLGLSKRRLDSV